MDLSWFIHRRPPSFVVSLVVPSYSPTYLRQFNYSIQIFIGLLMLFDVKSYLFHSFWWFLPQLEGPTTALPSGSRDPESQARTHRVARESRSWTRLGMALVVRRAPHLDDSTGLHWPTKNINQNQWKSGIQNQVSRWIQGQTQVTSFNIFQLWRDEQDFKTAMPHHLLVLSTDDQCHRFHPALALWLGQIWVQDVQGPSALIVGRCNPYQRHFSHMHNIGKTHIFYIILHYSMVWTWKMLTPLISSKSPQKKIKQMAPHHPHPTAALLWVSLHEAISQSTSDRSPAQIQGVRLRWACAAGA